ncbi:MAG: GIY-YIG nuclease family protein [Chitinophagaceae bacterium]|nr:GIY-YIG nuclease family protein [Chitinophagaceae bacterium]
MHIYKQHHYYVYIVTNPERTVLYTGVTNNLSQRLIERWVNKGHPKLLLVNTIATILFTLNIFLISTIQLQEKKNKGLAEAKES